MKLKSVLFTLCMVAAGLAGAQNAYPSRPVKLVVPFPAGGGADAVGRVVAQAMSKTLGQPVVIDNRAGATGLMGTDAVAKSPADGYTLLLAQVNSNAIAPHVYGKISFDPRRDFAAVGYIGYAPIVLVAGPSMPARSVAEVVSLAAREPGKYSYASDGNGGIAHIAGELFMQVAKVELLHVPYKGSSPAIADLLGGVANTGFFTLPPLLAHLSSGKLRALAISSSTRHHALPDVPTFAEAGFPSFDLKNWYGIAAPAGTPPAIIGRLNAALNEALAQPDVMDRLDKAGIEAGGQAPPAQFERFMRAELDRYGVLVRSARIAPGQ